MPRPIFRTEPPSSPGCATRRNSITGSGSGRLPARCSIVNAASDRLTRHYRQLLALGADHFPHVAGSLAPHLSRTAALLQQWGNRPALCLAGLYHAVYGTDGIVGSLVAL